MRKTFILLVVAIFAVTGTTAVFAESQEKRYSTGEELSQALIAETEDDGMLTVKEQSNLLANSSQLAQKELTEEAIKESAEILEAEDVSLGDRTFIKKSFDLDCGGTCTVTLSDGEDTTVLAELIGNLFFDKVYANTAPEVLWKDYGARRFTAWVDIALIGGITMKEVIHYNISDSGLKVTDHEALNDPPWGVFRIHQKTSVCEDAYAQIEGYDIHTAGKFWIYKDYQGYWTPYKIKLVRAKVQLLDLDKSGHKAQLYQTCEFNTL